MKKKFSLNTYYHSLGKAQKKEFKNQMLNLFNITELVFYAWVLRDNIPKRHRAKFANFLSINIDDLR